MAAYSCSAFLNEDDSCKPWQLTTAVAFLHRDGGWKPDLPGGGLALRPGPADLGLRGDSTPVCEHLRVYRVAPCQLTVALDCKPGQESARALFVLSHGTRLRAHTGQGRCDEAGSVLIITPWCVCVCVCVFLPCVFLVCVCVVLLLLFFVLFFLGGGRRVYVCVWVCVCVCVRVCVGGCGWVGVWVTATTHAQEQHRVQEAAPDSSTSWGESLGRL